MIKLSVIPNRELISVKDNKKSMTQQTALVLCNTECKRTNGPISLYMKSKYVWVCFPFDSQGEICPGCDMVLATEMLFTELMNIKHAGECTDA